MKWAIVSAANGRHTNLLNIARPTLERYAEIHLMDVVIDTLPMGPVPASWHKIPLLVNTLKDYDAVLWVDADAMFVRYDVDIRDVAKKPFNWVVNHYDKDWIDPPMDAPCAGILAVTYEGVDLLLDMWNLKEKYEKHPWWEQAAAHELTGWDPCWPRCEYVGGGRHEDIVGELPHEWNSTPASPCPDPIIFHTSGLSLDDRQRLMLDHAL